MVIKGAVGQESEVTTAAAAIAEVVICRCGLDGGWLYDSNRYGQYESPRFNQNMYPTVIAEILHALRTEFPKGFTSEAEVEQVLGVAEEAMREQADFVKRANDDLLPVDRISSLVSAERDGELMMTAVHRVLTVIVMKQPPKEWKKP
jgi:hypothetical protein